MKNKIIVILCVLFSMLLSCSTLLTKNKTQESLVNDVQSDAIKIYTVKDKLPLDALFLGTIKFNTLPLFKKCGFENTIMELKKLAQEKNGNLIQITSYKTYDGIGKSASHGCHTIKANIFHSKGVIPSKTVRQKKYSTIHIYRYFGSVFHKPKLYINDSLLFEIESNFSKEIKLDKKGKYIFKFSKGEDLFVLNNINFDDHYMRIGMDLESLNVIPKFYCSKGKLAELEYKLFKDFMNN